MGCYLSCFLHLARVADWSEITKDALDKSLIGSIQLTPIREEVVEEPLHSYMRGHVGNRVACAYWISLLEIARRNYTDQRAQRSFPLQLVRLVCSTLFGFVVHWMK